MHDVRKMLKLLAQPLFRGRIFLISGIVKLFTDRKISTYSGQNTFPGLNQRPEYMKTYHRIRIR